MGVHNISRRTAEQIECGRMRCLIVDKNQRREREHEPMQFWQGLRTPGEILRSSAEGTVPAPQMVFRAVCTKVQKLVIDPRMAAFVDDEIVLHSEQEQLMNLCGLCTTASLGTAIARTYGTTRFPFDGYLIHFELTPLQISGEAA